MYYTKQEVLKKINENPDCASEFLLTNHSIFMEDISWAIEETNRSFQRHKMPMQVVDIQIKQPDKLLWKLVTP